MTSRPHYFPWLLILALGLVFLVGAGLYRLASPGEAQMPEAVAASTDRIVFARLQAEPAGIFTVKLDGTGETVLFTEQERVSLGIGPLSVKFSPNGRLIMFLTGGPPGEGHWDPKRNALWLMNADGSGRRILVSGDENSWPGAAAWSPDSQWIAYSKQPVAGKKDRAELWLVKPDGSQAQLATNDPRFGPVTPGALWWFDANHVAWEKALPNTGRALLAIEPSSGVISILVEGASWYEAVLSPDGKKVALEVGKSPSLVKRPGVQAIQLSGGGARWSGDSSKVLYNAQGLWLLDLISGRRQLLVETRTGPANAQALSPDGRLALYATQRGLEMIDVQTRRSWVVASKPDTSSSTIWFIQWAIGS